MQKHNDKFLNFLESIKNKENSTLIEAVVEAFVVLNESHDPLSSEASNAAFKEEVSNEMEEESPIISDKVLKIGGYDVHILDHDNGNTEAWVKGIGDVASNPYWNKISMDEFINKIKIGILKRTSK